jgi:hypothetical protein
MNFNFLQPNKISFNQIKADTTDWLITTYSQAKSVLTKSSPYGQIISVLQEYSQLIFLYIEDALTELNIYTATKQRSIFGWARIAGHNPTRALSAQGTLNLKIKPAAEKPLNASYVMILNKTKLKCTNNSKKYFVHIGNSVGNLRIDLKSNDIVPIKIIQGELETQALSGTGFPLQSFTITSKTAIENEMVWITVNGEEYEVVDSLYDMTKGDKSCLVKTGLTNGIDIYFGNEDYGTIPAQGSVINVTYVKTDGFEGNIFTKSNDIEFKFDDVGYANTGDEVDLNELFNITIEKPVILGSDAEDQDLTKLIAPKTSRSYVLANPDNYVNFLSRFNYSYVDAYTTVEDDYIADDNVVYLFLIPDISRRLITNTDYFKTDLKNFYLDEDEKNAVIDFIDMSGRQIISTELQVVDPILTKYVLNVYIRIFDTSDQQTIKNEIINKITDYLLKVRRRDKIPKSDIIAVVENVTGVDSVNMSFVSEVNEKAINDGYYIQRVNTIDKVRGLTVVTENKIMLTEGEDPNLGLDDFGDIKIGLNEMPVIRGGFYDRFGNYYEDGINYNEYCSINIVVKDVIRETLSVKMMNSNKNSIKNA